MHYGNNSDVTNIFYVIKKEINYELKRITIKKEN